MSRNWTEDEIAAFVDGAASDEDARRIAALIESDEDARATADRLRRQNALLREAFAAPMAEATPLAIRSALGAPSPTGRAARRVEHRSARMARRRPPVWAGAALAACAAFAIGLGGAPALLGPAEEAGMRLAIGSAPAAALAALERAPSGTDVAGLTPLASFVTRDGHCREFETAGDAPSVGLACRPADGDWRVVALAAVAGAAPGADAAAGFAPASGAAVDALSAVLDALEAGPALSPAEEADRIAAGWR
ncbi:anti-sigma factor family protein [Rubrimonas cliftonensis]|uniref:Anti-sigma-K factor RskA n=1 Tax=Rubrimonas cliftonensis TaxID=89524 RepID=A0A1H4BRA6_9RHOB|nr:hypothetical protein [Rubrimonas cliftonensis]SEA50675.1 Anti-sigma-K factor RskA [Rubrimonas cliftonensis]